MSELFEESNDILHELQKDIIDEIDEHSFQIIGVTNSNPNPPPPEISLELVNTEFFDHNFYFGIINPQNNRYQYRLIPREGDNDKFIISENIVYSKFPYVFNKSEYSISIEASDPLQFNKIIKSFIIKQYNPNANYNTANIISCHVTQTQSILFTGFLSSIEMRLDLLSPVQGSIRQHITNFFIYTPPSDGRTPNDIIVFNIVNTNNGEIIGRFAIMIEVFDNNRIKNLPRQIGTHKFNNISFDTDTVTWHLGTYSTRDFFIFYNAYVIRNLHIFYNELF